MTLTELSVKNIRRNTLRSVLTVLGVAVAILSFVFLRTVLSAWTTGADYAAQDRLATWHRVTFVMQLPKRYVQDIRDNVPGVTATTYLNWFGAKHPVRENEFFATLAVETDTYFDVYHEMSVPPEQLEAWKQNRRGVIVGQALASKFGWKVGDSVTLLGTIYAGDWEFEIEGIYEATSRSIDRSQFLFHWDYLNESLPEGQRDTIGWITSRLADPSQSGAVSKAIDKMFDERDTQTQTMSERALQMQFLGSASAILVAIDIVSLVILVIMMLILGNTIAMGVRERTHEYGVMRAIGFRPKHIASFVMIEGVAIGLIGGALGLLVAYPLVEQGMGRFIEENMGSFFPYFRIPPLVAGVSLALAGGLAALASVIPAYRAARLNVTDALRRIG